MPSEENNTLWSHVTSVAKTLTINVNKAWTASIPTSAGEGMIFNHRGVTTFVLMIYVVTPLGQDSHLTRAMKAYHLGKARDPTDLPIWLFDERERRHPINLKSLHQDTDTAIDIINPGQRSLRSVNDSLSSTMASGNTPSKATQRLRAMREAKRSASGKTPLRHASIKRAATGIQQGGDGNPERPRAITTRRIGLPSGPRRM